MLTEDFLLFVDTETTGLVPGKDEIVEIASILTDFDLNEISRFDHKILPTIPVPKEVAAINGYDENVWKKEAVSFSKWKEWIHKSIPYSQLAIPVGHNVGFDRKMIEEKYYKPFKHFLPLSYHIIDTVSLAGLMKLAKLYNFTNLKLTTVMKEMNYEFEGHRAMNDCMASAEILKFCITNIQSCEI